MTVPISVLRATRLLVGVVLSAAVLTGAGFAAYYLMTHMPKPQRRPRVEQAPLVVVEDLTPGAEQVVITTWGTVAPAVEVSLQAQVTGEVIRRHPELIEGGLVKKGEVLVEIDPSDYELALSSSQTQLTLAESNLTVEKGQQDVARRGWEMLDMAEQASDLDRELALRRPQLRMVEAEVASAKVQVAQAELSLARTKIQAPLNAIVREASIEVGDLASQQTALAQLVGTDAYWVQVTVPVDELRWIEFPYGQDEVGSAVRITADNGHVREGHVLKLLSDLTEEVRLARVLVEIEDPLGTSAPGAPHPLLLGQYVRADILGKTVDHVVRVPRDALRDGDELWLASEDSHLRIESAEIVWSNTEYALLSGLGEEVRLIVSDLATPVDGMSIQVEGEEPAAETTPAAEGAPQPEKATEDRS